MIKNVILGAIVGDAIGVPYEFKHKSQIKEVELISDERRYLPEGTWSDDSSMILCTMDSIIKNGLDVKSIGDTYVQWYDNNLWTPYGRVFDIGNTTRFAMDKIKEGDYGGLNGEMDCGNGSLMRILPAAIATQGMLTGERIEYINSNSKLTHSHKRCLIACNIYSEFVLKLLQGYNVIEAFDLAIINIKAVSKNNDLQEFEHLFEDDFYNSTKYDDLSGSGYVIDTLSTVLWIVFNSKSYKESIEMAIKVGGDTDTIASLVGGITGMLYQDIPQYWIDSLVRKDEVLELINEFENVVDNLYYKRMYGYKNIHLIKEKKYIIEKYNERTYDENVNKRNTIYLYLCKSGFIIDKEDLILELSSGFNIVIHGFANDDSNIEVETKYIFSDVIYCCKVYIDKHEENIKGVHDCIIKSIEKLEECFR